MYLEEGAGKESFTRFIDRDPDALMKRAEAALERSFQEFPSDPADDDRLDRAARAKLAEDAGLNSTRFATWPSVSRHLKSSGRISTASRSS